MYSKGETYAKANIKPFRKQSDGKPVDVMVEGEEYRSAWIETQPMAGAMYAQRDVRVALNNQVCELQYKSRFLFEFSIGNTFKFLL